MTVVWILLDAKTILKRSAHNRVITRASGNINFSDLLKALKKDGKKVFSRLKKPLECPFTSGNMNTSSIVTKNINGTLQRYFCSKSTFSFSKSVTN